MKSGSYINLNRTYAKCGNKTRANFINLGWEKPVETIQGQKLFKGGTHSRKYGTQAVISVLLLSSMNSLQGKEYPNMRDNCPDEEIFLTVPTLPDGKCLFQALSIQMIGEPSKHAELSNILTTFIRTNPQLLGSGRIIKDCTHSQHLGIVTKVGQYGRHAEIKAAASLC